MNQTQMTELYAQTQRLLHATVHGFRLQHGGRPDDLLSEAHEYFVDACRNYDPELGPVKHHIRFRVWGRLLDRARQLAKHAGRLKRQPVDLTLVAQRQESDFNLQELMERLSEDARLLVRSVLHPPPEVVLSLRQSPRQSPRPMKSALLEFLRDLGWSQSRIQKGFSEVRTALCSG